MNELPNKDPVLRVMATPQEANPRGDIFGGWLMGQVDIAGSIPAVIRAQGKIATRAVKEMNFFKPLYPGDIVSLYAEVTAAGRTSMTVFVEAYVQRDCISLQAIKVSEASLVFVAMGDNGKPRALPAATTSR